MASLDYTIPLVGVSLPWACDYFCLLVGFVAFYRLSQAILLACLAELRSIDLSPYKAGSWAIVTGSTDGIGKGFAEALASRGINLISISRCPEKLKLLEVELQTKYQVQVHSRVWDFSNCAAELPEFSELVAADLDGKDISILVNNVGIAWSGHFHTMPLSAVAGMISVNCLAATYLCRLVLTKLRSRPFKTAVINLSSVVSFCLMPGTSLYCATKRFDSVLTTLLAQSLVGSDVVAMDLRPGYVGTQLTAKIKRTIEEKSSAPPASPFVTDLLTFGITPKQCAEAALRDLGSSLSIVGHFKHKAVGLLAYAVPEWLVATLMKRILISDTAL
jgi:17beta-estradiol 17-dehydrogenase / very-long-chain 3-oxoacyl-CoA reductase